VCGKGEEGGRGGATGGGGLPGGSSKHTAADTHTGHSFDADRPDRTGTAIAIMAIVLGRRLELHRELACLLYVYTLATTCS